MEQYESPIEVELRPPEPKSVAGTPMPPGVLLASRQIAEVRFQRRRMPRRQDRYRQTLGSYRDCPARRGWIEPGFPSGAVSIGSFELSFWRLRWTRGSSYALFI